MSSKCSYGKHQELIAGFHELSRNTSWHFWDFYYYYFVIIPERKQEWKAFQPQGKSPAKRSYRKSVQVTLLPYQPGRKANRWSASFSTQEWEFPLKYFVSCQVAFSLSGTARNQPAQQHASHFVCSQQARSFGSETRPCSSFGFLWLGEQQDTTLTAVSTWICFMQLLSAFKMCLSSCFLKMFKGKLQFLWTS